MTSSCVWQRVQFTCNPLYGSDVNWMGLSHSGQWFENFVDEEYEFIRFLLDGR